MKRVGDEGVDPAVDIEVGIVAYGLSRRLLPIAKKLPQLEHLKTHKWHATAAPQNPNPRNEICKTFLRSVKCFAINLLRKLLFLHRILNAKRFQKCFQIGLAMILRVIADASSRDFLRWLPFHIYTFYERSVKSFECAGEGLAMGWG
jgi:hypothetical protein